MHFTPDEVKLIAISSHIWIKMLQEKEHRVLGRIRGAFRAGEKDFLSLITEYTIIHEQIQEITRSTDQGAQP